MLNEKERTVNISRGNSKMGDILSVSLPPCKSCNVDAPCFSKCYANKLLKRYPSVNASYNHNWEVLNNHPADYWNGILQKAALVRFFRFHVAGDIVNEEYFEGMVLTAKLVPTCTFLAFTKQYDIVNNWITKNGDLPENLKILFSLWDPAWNVRVKNPYDLPTCHIIFKNKVSSLEYTRICGGNCAICAICNIGCWTLKKGECIAIFEH